MSTQTPIKKSQRPDLKNVLLRLSVRNEGVVANMAAKHLNNIRYKDLDAADAHQFVKDIHWQINESKGKDNATFEPEIVSIVNQYISAHG